MKRSDNKGYQGITFGLMSGIITLLGIMFGLSVTRSKFAMIIGMVVAGIADAFSDAAAMHVAQETETHHSRKGVWLSTIYTFWGKVGMMVVLVLPFLFLDIWPAVIVAGVLGMIGLVIIGLMVAKIRKQKAIVLCLEYVAIGVVVSGIAYGLGELIKYIASVV